MKEKLWLTVVAGLVVGGSAFAKQSIPVDDGVVRDVSGLEALLVEQQLNVLPVSPPSEKVYVHRFKIPVAIDFKKFPKGFSSQVFAEMQTVDGSLFPVYEIFAYEDPSVFPREVVFENSGVEIYRMQINDLGYDPLEWQTLRFGEVLEDPLMRWVFDPAHIAVRFVALVPEIFHADYLAAQEAEALLMEPMGMAMMSLPQSPTGLVVGIGGSNGTVEVEVGWGDSFQNRIDVFGCTNLIAGSWSVLAEKLPTIGVDSLVWIDIQSNLSFCAYRAGDADTDSDNDFLSDARELVVHHSLTNSADSDGGQIPDGYEVANNLDPNDSTDDTAAAFADYLTVAGDADMDLRPLWRESQQGTNPNDCFD